MKRFKYIFFITIISGMSCAGFSQKQIFDIATYAAPKGWQENKTDGHISYSRVNGTSWAQIAIYKSTASTGNRASDFEKEWNELVEAGKTVAGPDKQASKTLHGWNSISGSGTWQYNGANVTSVLTVYSNDKIYFSVLCNTTASVFLKDYHALLESLVLNVENVNEGSEAKHKLQPADSSGNNRNNSLMGLWVYYNTESNGVINGMPQLTGGYMRREYVFNKDGTYVFRAKDWMVYVKDILFVYETGTYVIKGNQITITPQKGKGEWWSKTASGRTDEWGKLVRASTNYKSEKTAYTFELFTNTGASENVLLLQAPAPTCREGKDGNKTGKQQFRYTSRDPQKSLIDYPPGWKKL
ncbi:MAG: hypothetical protein U0V75_12575 [Ferruginibacter sp.]